MTRKALIEALSGMVNGENGNAFWPVVHALRKLDPKDTITVEQLEKAMTKIAVDQNLAIDRYLETN